MRMLRQAQHEVVTLSLRSVRVHREPSASSALRLFAARSRILDSTYHSAIARRAQKAFLGMVLLSLAACSVFSTDRALQKQPSFKEGYEDGCAAANAQGADLRDRTVGDKQLYANDETYRKGWSAGFQTCRRSDIEPNAAPGDSPIRLPGPGH